MGFTTPRALGKAVVRNRIRRRVREAARLELAQLSPEWCIVFPGRRRSIARSANFRRRFGVCLYDAVRGYFRNGPLRIGCRTRGRVGKKPRKNRLGPHLDRHRLQAPDFATTAIRMPFLSYLFGLHARGHRGTRAGARGLAGHEAAGSLPSVSRGRV